MNILTLIAISLVVLGTLFVIDIKVKSGRSILTKIISIIFVGAFLFGLVYFYGETILDLLHVDVKSFTNLKDFFSSRILGALAFIIFYMFVLLKAFHVTFKFIQNRTFTRGEKAFTLMCVVFDIAVVPCIVLAGSFSVVLAVIPAILSLIEIGLVSAKELGFSFIFNRKSEVVLG